MKILLINGKESDMFLVSKKDLFNYLSHEAPLEKPISPDIVVVNNNVTEGEEALVKELESNYNRSMGLNEYLETLKTMLNLIS